MSSRREVLVAILKTPDALVRARELGWYHIPVEEAQKRLKGRWPPERIAFYQGKVHGDEAYSISYYAQVRDIRQVLRRELFPHEAEHKRANKEYHKLILGPLQRLPKPILSRRFRRIVFIPTTWDKFKSAVEINDLYDESPLEDRLWAELKRLEIAAERQEMVRVRGRDYALDFAIYCRWGKLDVETDGDTWHAEPKRIHLDNMRDNALVAIGWSLLRFNGRQIREEMNEYCLPTIIGTINNSGGLKRAQRIRVTELKGCSVEEVGRKYPNAYRKWAEQDDIRIATDYRAGKTVEQLAEAFERSPGAIRRRLRKLKLRR